MKQLLKILTVHSGRDLIKYKSFFLLIFGLIVLDRAIHHWVPTRRPDLEAGDLHAFSLAAAAYVFEEMPLKLLGWLTDGRTLALMAGLFLLKQIISLWPSSDMRRMHRQERGRFGILAALSAIRWQQIVWDAAAVSTVCGVLGIWLLAALSATPVYAYLKMASFKFFLFTYGRFSLVREEFPEYFTS